MSERPVLQRSLNTQRALTAPRPRLRGTSHLLAAVLSVPIGVVWWLSVDPGRPRLAVGAFLVGVGTMFGCSALLHLRRWAAGTYEALFRLDHTGIYLAIGGTGVAIASLGLQGVPRLVLLGVSVVGVSIGILVEWLPFAPPRGFSNTVYITLGWVPVVLLPWLWMTAGWVTVVLLLAGGVLYTSGAIMLALQRPDPFPTWFGYHELWHLFVIVAVVIHGVMIARLA
jgi:hemolysin III